MSSIEICGHATYLLLVASYLVRDLVWLRVISIPASLCSIAYHYLAPAEPLWLIIHWNLVFLTVHVVQLALTFHAQRTARLTGTLADFAQQLSPRLSAVHSVRLFKRGNVSRIAGPTTLLQENDSAEELLFLLDGKLDIIQRGQSIGQCEAGAFIGEISFLTGRPYSATVAIGKSETATIVRWNQSNLKKAAASHPEFFIALQGCLAAHLSETLGKKERTTRSNERDGGAITPESDQLVATMQEHVLSNHPAIQSGAPSPL